MNSVFQRRKGGGNGGSIGSVIGGAAALLAAPFTGGASLALAGPAMTVGGIVGGAADGGPKQAPAPKVIEGGAMEKRLAQPTPPPESQILKQSLQALHDSQDKTMQEGYGKQLFDAYNQALYRERGGKLA